jgi:hypothetical protein
MKPKLLVKVASAALVLFLAAGCDKEEKEVALSAIKVVPAQVNLAVGGIQPLTAVATPDDASEVTFVWSSADKSVATVSNTGMVTAVAVGNTTVKVTGGGIEKSVPVSVVEGYGSLSITTDWSDRHAGVSIPFSYKVTAGNFAGTAFDAAFTPEYQFDPGTLTVVAYAEADGITVEGHTATLESADGFFNATPGWFFSGVQTLTVVKDAGNPVAIDMHQQVGLLILELPVLPLVTSMNATLSGLATQIDLETGAVTGDAGSIAFDFTRTGNSYTATVRPLGTVGATQTLTLTLNYPDGTSKQVAADLSAALATFNNNKATLLSPNVVLPITFAPQVTNAVVHSGYKRVEVEFNIAAAGINTVKVYGNNYQHLADVSVNNATGAFSAIIENLEESTIYTFQIFSVDGAGNLSLPVEVQGEAFGDNRISQVRRNRDITAAIYKAATSEVTVNWGAVVTNSTGCTLTYTGTDNQPKTVSAAPDATSTTLPNWKSGLHYATQFVLGTGNVAHTFSADETSQRVLKEVPKTGWTATAKSYHGNFYPSQAIDGNAMNPWHSNASENLPQWLTIDFGAGNAQLIDGIVYQGRIDDVNDRGFPKKVVWEVSDDNATWTTILSVSELEYFTDYGVEHPLWLPCTTPATARYLRCTISETWPNSRNYTYFGEMGIYQYVE